MFGVLISLVYITGVFVVGSAKDGELLTKTSVVTMCLVCSILVSVAFTSIMTMLAILNTNKAGNVVVSMLLALILLVSGSFIYQKMKCIVEGHNSAGYFLTVRKEVFLSTIRFR